MANTFAVSRVQLVYALCLPLAVLLGYFLADPMDTGSMAVIGLVLGALLVPLVMRWYHPLLILAWNALIQPFFFPGQMAIWIPLAWAGFVIALLGRFAHPDAKFINVPSLTKPLLCLTGVIGFTCLIRGGFHLQIFGSSTFGGKNYFVLLASIAGYFALVSKRIPVNRAGLLIGLFFLVGFTGLIPNLAWLAGGNAQFLFNFFPPSYAYEQAVADYSFNPEIVRIGGLIVASPALLCWLLMRYGIRGLFVWTRPWRFALLSASLTGALYCGFRSTFILCLLILGAQFFLDGLFRTRILVGLAGGFLVLACIVVPNADRLPMVVQRTISFLPVPVSPVAKRVGEASNEWRLNVWKEALPDVPKYLLAGKGYAIDPTELQFAADNQLRHFREGTELAAATGVYHNGPLSVIIPLGIWGVIGFGWLLVASFKYLYRHYRYGNPELRRVNTLLLAYFVAHVLLFLFVFGAFAVELCIFTGVMGLSVSLNGAEIPEPTPEVVSSSEEEELGYDAHFAPEHQGASALRLRVEGS